MTTVACIGLISDTHMPQRWASLPSSLPTIFADVDLILHAGDVGELWVLDELSHIAPVIAVQGNDDSEAAHRELPIQQLLSVGGKRLLLWHSHFLEQHEEMAFRQIDAWEAKLDRISQTAQQAGCHIAVYGHTHIPMFVQHESVFLINPGAIASGSVFSRQIQQTVALLYIQKNDTSPMVTHINLAAPQQPFQPHIDLQAGFRAASQHYEAPLMTAHDKQVIRHEVRPLLPANTFWVLLHRIAHRCWAGHQAMITLSDFLIEVQKEATIPDAAKAAIQTKITNI